MLERYKDEQLQLLHPHWREPFRALAARLADDYASKRTRSLFRPFEGYRHPIRQNWLFDTKATKARAFQSPHQFGLAVDFVAFETGKWSWSDSHDWDHLKRAAETFGLAAPIEWDRVHVEVRHWQRIRQQILYV